jgi:hypothetical protein
MNGAVNIHLNRAQIVMLDKKFSISKLTTTLKQPGDVIEHPGGFPATF